MTIAQLIEELKQFDKSLLVQVKMIANGVEITKPLDGLEYATLTKTVTLVAGN